MQHLVHHLFDEEDALLLPVLIHIGETHKMENQMDKKMENEMETVGI